MSDDRAAPSSIAEAMYGPSGPVSDGAGLDQARRMIDSGIAKPAAEIPARPLFSDNGQTRPPAPDRAPSTDRMFDASRLPGDGQQADSAVMREFTDAAHDIGLRQGQAEKLIGLHRKAMSTEMDRYAAHLEQHHADELARTIPSADVAAAQSLLYDDAYTPPSLRDWAIRWASVHPDFARMIAAWGAAAARGRRGY
jgi:hypothetical protein